MANTKKNFNTMNKTIKSKYNSKIKRKNKKRKTRTNKKRKFKKNKVGGAGSYKLKGSNKKNSPFIFQLAGPGTRTGTGIRRPVTGIRRIKPLSRESLSLKLDASQGKSTEPPQYFSNFIYRDPRTNKQKRNNAERFKNSILMQEVKVNPSTGQYTFRGFTAPNLDKLFNIISINNITGELMINSPKPNLPQNLKGFFNFDTVTTGPYSKTRVTQDGSKYTEV